MDMGLDTHNSDLKYELCGILEEENDRTTSGVVDEHNLVGVEYNGENAEIKSQIEEKLLEFLYEEGIYTTFIEKTEDGAMIFEKSGKQNINISFSYESESVNDSGLEKSLGRLSKEVLKRQREIKRLLESFFKKKGIKIFSGVLQFGFNNGQVALNGININTLKLGDHLVFEGDNGKKYIDGNYTEEELNGIGGKDGSYWRKLREVPDDIKIKDIIAWKDFGEERLKELLRKINDKNIISKFFVIMEENTKRVQELVFDHGPEWQQDNWSLVKDWET